MNPLGSRGSRACFTRPVAPVHRRGTAAPETLAPTVEFIQYCINILGSRLCTLLSPIHKYMSHPGTT